MPGCSTMPAFSGSPSPGIWPVSVMRTPRPSSVLLRPSPGMPEPRHAGARQQERAGSPRGTKRARSVYILAAVRRRDRQFCLGSLWTAPRCASPGCAVPHRGPKRSTFPDIDERTVEQPGAVQQSVSLPRAPPRTFRGRGRNAPRRAGTRRSVRVPPRPRCPVRRTGAARTRRCSRSPRAPLPSASASSRFEAWVTIRSGRRSATAVTTGTPPPPIRTTSGSGRRSSTCGAAPVTTWTPHPEGAGGGGRTRAGVRVAVHGDARRRRSGPPPRRGRRCRSRCPRPGRRCAGRGGRAGRRAVRANSPSPVSPALAVRGGGQRPAPDGLGAGRPAIQAPVGGGLGPAADDDDDVGVAPGVVGGLVRGEDGDPLAYGAEFLADHEGAVDSVEQQGEFGGSGAGGREDGDLVVGADDVDRAAQGARVGDDDLGVVPGHPGAGEGGGDGGDGGDDLDLQAVLRLAQGAYDAEEAGVAVGEDDGAAAVAGDPAGGQVDAAEADALGALGDFGRARGGGRRRRRAWRPRARRCAAPVSGEPSQPITVTRSAIVVSLLGCEQAGRCPRERAEQG